MSHRHLDQNVSGAQHLEAVDTIGNYNCLHIKNLLGNKQWRAVDSIKHSEKRLPL